MGTIVYREVKDRCYFHILVLYQLSDWQSVEADYRTILNNQILVVLLHHLVDYFWSVSMRVIVYYFHYCKWLWMDRQRNCLHGSTLNSWKTWSTLPVSPVTNWFLEEVIWQGCTTPWILYITWRALMMKPTKNINKSTLSTWKMKKKKQEKDLSTSKQLSLMKYKTEVVSGI